MARSQIIAAGGDEDRRIDRAHCNDMIRIACQHHRDPGDVDLRSE